MIKWEAQEISENKQQSLKMTNFSQNGHSCSASSNLGNDYPAWRPFGYNSTALANQWCSAKGAKEAYLNYSFDSLICVTKMEFCNPLDEGLSTTSNFTLQGAMDNNGPWNDIQTFSNVPDKTVQTLNIQNNNYYKHYRVHFTKPNNNWESGTIRCSWLKYFGTKKIVKKYEIINIFYGVKSVKKVIIGSNKLVYEDNPYTVEYHNSKHNYSNQHYSCSIAWPTAELQNMVVKKFSTWSTTRRMSGDSYVDFSCTSANSSTKISKSRMVHNGSATAEGTLDGIHYKITANSADNYGRYDVEFDKPIKLSAITGGCGSGVGQYRNQDHMYMEIWGFKKK